MKIQIYIHTPGGDQLAAEMGSPSSPFTAAIMPSFSSPGSCIPVDPTDSMFNRYDIDITRDLVAFPKPGQDPLVGSSITFNLRLSAPEEAPEVLEDIVVNQAAEAISALNMSSEGTQALVGFASDVGPSIEQAQGLTRTWNTVLERLELFVKLTNEMSAVSPAIVHSDI